MTAARAFARGGIWTADLGGKRRPVVIVTSDPLCTVLSRLTVAGITSTRRGVPTEVEIGRDEGLAEGSIINALDLVTLATSALDRYRGELGPAGRRELDDALRVALGLEVG